jgi:exonuclease 3'-5' domain-containing protein 1
MFATPTLAAVFVDTVTQLQILLDELASLPASPTSLYLGPEGIQLSQDGTISILTLYALPLNMVCLIDIFKLKEEAFWSTTVDNVSLKTILESPTIPKVFFDVRNDSDALHHHYAIHLDCVQDVRLMENATRHYSKKLVSGLQKRIENDINAPPYWTATRMAGKPLFVPERGGDYTVFSARPMAQAIVDYCAVDMILLPQVWSKYNTKLQQLSYAG